MSKSPFKSLFIPLLIILALPFLDSCNRDRFTISGTLDNAKDSLLLLEKPDFTGNWVVIDSVRLAGSGKFAFHSDALPSSEIFRLSIGNRYIYVPVDSTQTITVDADAADFGTAFTLSGSADAEKMQKFESTLSRSYSTLTGDETKSAFKRRLFSEFLQNNHGSIVGYYILTKTIGNKPLFNPLDPVDYKYFAAVATDFRQFAPEDPRCKLLEEITIEAMRRRNADKGLQRVVEAEELNLLEIALPDENGVERRLSEIAAQGRPTVVVFSLMNEPESPEVNRALADLYRRFNGGINIYHVSLDSDLHAWREAAANLPWTTVIDMAGPQSAAALTYNVNRLPAYFIYDSAGHLVNGTDDVTAIPSMIR